MLDLEPSKSGRNKGITPTDSWARGLRPRPGPEDLGPNGKSVNSLPPRAQPHFPSLVEHSRGPPLPSPNKIPSHPTILSHLISPSLALPLPTNPTRFLP